MAPTAHQSNGESDELRTALDRVRNVRPGNTTALMELIDTGPSELVAAEALRRLADHGTSRALGVVRSTLEDDRPGVRAEAALQLARTGRKADIEAVGAVQARAPVAARKVRFAKALIAHRFGSPVRPLEVGELRWLDSKAPGVRRVVVRQLRAEQIADATATLAHSFGVALSDSGVELVCGTDRTWIVLSDLAASAPTDELIARPGVLAVGMSPEEETGRWSPDWVVLGTPRRDGAALRVFSTSGRLQFAGRAEVEEGDLHFEVAPVADQNGPAFAVSGATSDGAIQVTAALQSARPTPGSTPKPAGG